MDTNNNPIGTCKVGFHVVKKDIEKIPRRKLRVYFIAQNTRKHKDEKSCNRIHFLRSDGVEQFVVLEKNLGVAKVLCMMKPCFRHVSHPPACFIPIKCKSYGTHYVSNTPNLISTQLCAYMLVRISLYMEGRGNSTRYDAMTWGLDIGRAAELMFGNFDS